MNEVESTLRMLVLWQAQQSETSPSADYCIGYAHAALQSGQIDPSVFFSVADSFANSSMPQFPLADVPVGETR